MEQIQASVVQTLDSAIYCINHYPVEKCWEEREREIYTMPGYRYSPFEQLGPDNYVCLLSSVHIVYEHEAGQLAMFSSNPCEISFW